ncbi:MAG: sigma-54 dependent transcriptional regulator [Flavobacteriales bacterium]|nr:sigma-54 dependent transcriptional regulator [Flavobacteriales bacterium]MCX7768723.1 sigma-54 dependent transcriptional regulator [Flavobacteriales bacterium]MDW8409883.1 sigma-54 dependent transcriptional regulator [Flavobacteriales bacterium]
MNAKIQEVKNRFGIVGQSPALDHALEVALQVAPTNLTVLLTGESGVGKEIFSKIIHQYSPRRHQNFIAVNCGAIPPGTIDSELFGHEKGAFTGASEARKGYFEVVNGGTIFLDEVAELPLETQVRLLRVLETGEFIRVGSSKVQKTDVRVVAATNVNMLRAIETGKFREDLYYRLNTVPIRIPALRERPSDIPLLIRKFAADFSEQYHIPPVRFTEEAMEVLLKYRWPGNIRQLKNFTEQISILEKNRLIDADTVRRYLPEVTADTLPVLASAARPGEEPLLNDPEHIIRLIFEMRRDINDLKKIVLGLLQSSTTFSDLAAVAANRGIVVSAPPHSQATSTPAPIPHSETIRTEESLSLVQKERDLIEKALQKYQGHRRRAAQELGISERTLYRKIKEYDIKA